MSIIQEIAAERASQTAKWGHAADDGWSPGEWAALLAHYATRQAVGDMHAIDYAKLRADMVKAGALTVACIEAIDRKANP